MIFDNKKMKIRKEIKSFIESYFTNLFIILGIILLITEIFQNVPFVDSFRTLLVLNQGYYVVLIPLTFTEIYYDVMVIVKNKEFFSKIKNNKLQFYTVLIILAMSIFTEFFLFRIDIIKIIADKFPIIVTNEQNYQSGIMEAAVLVYFAIPILHYVSLWFFKRSLSVKTEFEHNRFKINLTPVVFWICMSFIFALTYVTVTYCINGCTHN